MDDLIFDAVSIFMQVLIGFAPEYVGDYVFLIIGYSAACLFVLMVLWCFFRLLSAFAKAVLVWFSRGC